MKEIQLTKDNYPLLVRECQFTTDLISGWNDKRNPVNVGEYNLIVTMRDLKLWTKFKMKPHGFWKVSQVKEYFALKGNGEVLMERFTELFDEVQKLKEDLGFKKQ